MARDVARDWMWSEACEMLARAERMHREIVSARGNRRRGCRHGSRRSTFWRPNTRCLALVALPGVDAESAQAVIEDGDLVIAGTRVLPPELRTANIHRLELPQGRYYRRLRLPAGRYSAVRRAVANGCLVITLQKAGINRG